MPIILNDSVTLDSAGHVDDSGFWHTTARFARTGVQSYSMAELQRGGCTEFSSDNWDAAKPVRLLRPDAAVFDVDSMRTFEHVPLTVEHEGGKITPDNAKGTVVGVSKAPVVRDEQGRLAVPVVVYDRAAIEDAKDGTRKELSAGSQISIERGDGDDKEFGVYDAAITKICGNHISIVGTGKAGPEFTLGDTKMSESRNYRGLTVVFDAQGAQAFDAIAADLVAVNDTLGTVRDDLKNAKKERDELQAKIDVADTVTPVDIDALVAERTTILDNVKRITPAVAPTGKTNAELKLEAVKAAMPTIIFDGKSEDYIAAMFDAAINMPGAPTAPAAISSTGSDAARKDFIKNRSGR